MIQNHTAAEILRNGLAQGACHGAPSDFMANLRGALAFVEKAPEAIRQHDEPSVTISPLVDVAPGASADE